MILGQYFFASFDLHLIGREVNHQAGNLTFDSNKTKKMNSTTSFLGLLLLFVIFNLGSLSNSTWHVPKTEATTQTWAVSSTASQLRSTIPEREVRRILAQSRPSAAPQKITRPSQTQFFISLCLANNTSTDQVMTSIISSIAVFPSLLPAWGFGAAPVTQDVPRAIASSAVPKQMAADRGAPGEEAGRRSPRWLLRVFVDPRALFVFYSITLLLDRYPKTHFVKKFYPTQIKFIFFYSIMKKVSR